MPKFIMHFKFYLKLLQMCLVSENLLKKVQKQQYKKLHRKWDKYDNGEIQHRNIVFWGPISVGPGDIGSDHMYEATCKISRLGPAAKSIDNYD